MADELRPAGARGWFDRQVVTGLLAANLFMVGLVLFTLTLGINYFAQKIVARYRMSIG